MGGGGWEVEWGWRQGWPMAMAHHFSLRLVKIGNEFVTAQRKLGIFLPLYILYISPFYLFYSSELLLKA